MWTEGLIRNRRYHIFDGFARDEPSRLERPGIEPGAERCIKPSAGTIEAPQQGTITRWLFGEKWFEKRSTREPYLRADNVGRVKSFRNKSYPTFAKHFYPTPIIC